MATGTLAPRYDFVCEPVPEPSRFRLLAETPLPTDHGDVTLYVYGDGNCSPWSVCVYGEVRGRAESQCGYTTRMLHQRGARLR